MKAGPLRPVPLVVAVLGGGAWQRVDAGVRVTPVESHRVSAEVLHRSRSRGLAKYQGCKLYHYKNMQPLSLASPPSRLLPDFQCYMLKFASTLWQEATSKT